MPGLNDPTIQIPLHLSRFFRYATGVAVAQLDPTGDVSDINYTNQPHALNSRLCAVVRRTAGTGRVKLSFHFQPADGGDLKDVWLLDRTSEWLTPDVLFRFADLYAGKFKLTVSAIEDVGGVFDIYVAQESKLQADNLV